MSPSPPVFHETIARQSFPDKDSTVYSIEPPLQHPIETGSKPQKDRSSETFSVQRSIYDLFFKTVQMALRNTRKSRHLPVFSKEYRADTIHKNRVTRSSTYCPQCSAPFGAFFFFSLRNLFLSPPVFVLHMHNLTLILMRNTNAVIWHVASEKHKIL